MRPARASQMDKLFGCCLGGRTTFTRRLTTLGEEPWAKLATCDCHILARDRLLPGLPISCPTALR